MEFPSFCHHITICTSDCESLVVEIVEKFGFKLIASRKTINCQQFALRCGQCTFLISKAKDTRNNESYKLDQLDTFCDECLNGNHTRDTAFDIAMEVKDVANTVEEVLRNGGHLLKPISVLTDQYGSVEIAVVSSCCGNIVHTLLNKQKYHGEFLPQFINNTEVKHPIDSWMPTHIDHVAIVVNWGKMRDTLSWYKKAFGMKRFLIHLNDKIEDALVLDGDVGFKLTALEFWHCSEVALTITDEDTSNRHNQFKLVVAEPLSGHVNSQVQRFLDEHGGPGIQHVALHSSTMLNYVAETSRKGVLFRMPPASYYTMTGKLEEMNLSGENPQILQKLGVLLDAEADPIIKSNIEEENNYRYLMQIFTYPILDKDSFFLEVIQRKKAYGFGAGNISALARSIREDQEKSDYVNY